MWQECKLSGNSEGCGEKIWVSRPSPIRRPRSIWPLVKWLQFYVKGVELKREFYIIYHQNKFLNKLAKDFMALCFKMKERDREENE